MRECLDFATMLERRINMKRGKSKLLSGLLSMSMAFSVISAPIEAFAATDTSGHWAEASVCHDHHYKPNKLLIQSCPTQNSVAAHQIGQSK